MGGSVTVAIATAPAPSADSLTDDNKPSANDLAYTGSAQALVNAPSVLPSGYDQVWYSTDGGNTWSQSIPTGTDAGNYNVSVKYVDTDNNYADLIGVTVPVIPGIMPITNANQVARAIKLSGSFMPQRFKSLVDYFGNDPEAMKQAGIAYATDQIIDLYANGITNVHVYSMNKPDVAISILNNLSDILGKDFQRGRLS